MKLTLLYIALHCFTLHAYNIKNDVDKFGLTNIYTKLVNDRGNGFPGLKGTRNFRAVLSNTMYRGGKLNPAGNQNPMTEEGLINLCKAGFTTVVYLYSINFNSAPTHIDCKTNRLEYKQITFTQTRKLLELVYSNIKTGNYSYLHCHNGYHASGRISALALRQFCDLSGTDAVAYWIKNTDGTDNGDYESHKTYIRNFVPYSDLNLTLEEKEGVCF